MSFWTYIKGVVEVSPLGRTQAEMEYILTTVLEHLPIVSGSERDMEVHIVKKNGHNSSSSHDEFIQATNNLKDRYGRRSRKRGWFKTQSEYILVVEGNLRDRMFEETFREFQKWLCRLAKRIIVTDVLVNIEGYGIQKYDKKDTVIRKNHYNTEYEPYCNMFESPTWSYVNKDNEPNWCEYLMWDRAKHSDLPIMLEYKYYKNKENDREVERRLKYTNGE